MTSPRTDARMWCGRALPALLFSAFLLNACGGGPVSVAPAGIGVATRMLADSSRSTPANQSAPESPMRSLPTEIWYPSAIPFDFMQPSAARDAALAVVGRPFPLVLFVHGSSGGRRQSTWLTEGLAGAGYVVVAADFPLTSASTPGGPSDLHVDGQLGDLAFLADRMAAFSRDASDPLAGAIDPDAGYAVVGHSTGGTVALLAAYASDRPDARVKAAAALAPCACFFGDSFFKTRSTPLLVSAGTDDLFVPISNNGRRAFDLAMPPKFMATLVGGTHILWTDANIPDSALHPMPTTAHDDLSVALARYGGGTACEPVPAPSSDPVMSIDDQHAIGLRVVRAFLDENLRNDASAMQALAASPPPNLRLERAE